jgi:hypothetical protein
MTRGTEATDISREVRDGRNPLILHLDVVAGKMTTALLSRGSKTFAQKWELVSAIQHVVRELTPGPRGPGED